MSNSPAKPNTGEQDSQASRCKASITSFENGAFMTRNDQLAVERALEIHIAGAEPLITMRTPGHDRELAAGLLHGEGVIESSDDIVYLKHSLGEPDVIRLMLKPAARARLSRVERNTLANSACGVCGKPSFAPPRGRPTTETANPPLDPALLLSLPDRLREAQGVFESTGGLHAAGLFDLRGERVAIREDVGRHNALDKLIGWALLDSRLPLADHILMLSGRASYELLQKSIAAGINIVCAISAPSSFAVDLADQFGITLIGFLRGDRFNIYAGKERIQHKSRNPD